MSNSYSPVKLGFCPIGKFVFSHEDALRFKRLLEDKLNAWGVNFVSLDGVLKDGIIRSQKDVAPVVDYFKQQDVDAVFMPHCNFGTEGAVGAIGAKLGVPVLLWGPRDEAPLPDGTRLRDTLCGLLASSKVLHKLKVPFTYIENCRIDEPALKDGVDMFLRAVNAANAFRKGTRIGHIGQRIDFFWSTIINESELLDRFNVEIQPIDMVEFIRHAKDRAATGRSGYLKEIDNMRGIYDISAYKSEDPLINVLAVRDQMLALAEEYDLEGLAVQDFDSLVDETGSYCFYAESEIDGRCAIGYESDIHGAISCILAQRAEMNTKPSFLADITIRHPENDNGVLLWHCGAPLSMKHPDSKVCLGHHWILPSPLPGMPHFRLKDGPITVARFDGDNGEYLLAVGEGKSIDGPETLNNYVWMEVNNWPKWERTFIEGPFIHHAAMSYGHTADALAEACKYINGLKAVRLGE